MRSLAEHHIGFSQRVFINSIVMWQEHEYRIYLQYHTNKRVLITIFCTTTSSFRN